MSRGLFGVKAIAAALGVTPRVVMAMARSGELPTLGIRSMPATLSGGQDLPRESAAAATELDMSHFIASLEISG